MANEPLVMTESQFIERRISIEQLKIKANTFSSTFKHCYSELLYQPSWQWFKSFLQIGEDPANARLLGCGLMNEPALCKAGGELLSMVHGGQRCWHTNWVRRAVALQNKHIGIEDYFLVTMRSWRERALQGCARQITFNVMHTGDCTAPLSFHIMESISLQREVRFCLH